MSAVNLPTGVIEWPEKTVEKLQTLPDSVKSVVQKEGGTLAVGLQREVWDETWEYLVDLTKDEIEKYNNLNKEYDRLNKSFRMDDRPILTAKDPTAWWLRWGELILLPFRDNIRPRLIAKGKDFLEVNDLLPEKYEEALKKMEYLLMAEKRKKIGDLNGEIEKLQEEIVNTKNKKDWWWNRWKIKFDIPTNMITSWWEEVEVSEIWRTNSLILKWLDFTLSFRQWIRLANFKNWLKHTYWEKKLEYRMWKIWKECAYYIGKTKVIENETVDMFCPLLSDGYFRNSIINWLNE